MTIPPIPENFLPEAPPDGWGTDLLSSSFDTYRLNQYATYAHHPTTKRILAIDKLFTTVLLGARDPKPMTPMIFILRTHSAYRAAAGAVMAGQIYESNAVLRVVLELPAYAAYIGGDNKRYETWMRRHDSVAHKQAVLDEFRPRKIISHMRTMSRTLADDYEELYEETIDQGAHPNERGFSFNTLMEKGLNERSISQVYLHRNGPQLDLGMLQVTRVGLWAMHIYRLFYAERFKLLGVSMTMDDMRAEGSTKRP